MTACGRVCR